MGRVSQRVLFLFCRGRKSPLFCRKDGKRRSYYTQSFLYSAALFRYNTFKEVMTMTVRQRLLAIRLLQELEKHPDYAGRIGVSVCMVNKDPENKEEQHD